MVSGLISVNDIGNLSEVKSTVEAVKGLNKSGTNDDGQEQNSLVTFEGLYIKPVNNSITTSETKNKVYVDSVHDTANTVFSVKNVQLVKLSVIFNLKDDMEPDGRDLVTKIKIEQNKDYGNKR